MVTVEYDGRLGNNIIQYVAGCMFSKKHHLGLVTAPSFKGIDWGSLISFPYEGNIVKNGPCIMVNDDNFMSLYSNDSIPPAHYYLKGCYQLKDFLCSNIDEILKLFKLSYKQIPEDRVFVAYRIGDQLSQRQMLPIEYYIEAIEAIGPSGGVITSDTMNHPFVLELSKKFNLKLCAINNPLEVINYAKDFNNIVLSEGSFSWLIGVLSKAKNIYFNDRERFWHGDMFHIPGWKKLSWDYDKSAIHGYKIMQYKPIKLEIKNG